MGSKDLFNSQLATARILNANATPNVNYYSIDLTHRLRLIVLDFFEISILGPNRKDKQFFKNQKLIDHYSNLRILSKYPWEKDYLNRFQENNGAVHATQLVWLRKQLEECKNLEKKVLLTGHNPILREASDSHQSWNSEEILEVIWSFSDTVLAHLNGHIHIGMSIFQIYIFQILYFECLVYFQIKVFILKTHTEFITSLCLALYWRQERVKASMRL